MGVFFEEANYPQGQQTQGIERCKRDYEAEIARLVQLKKVTDNLEKAVEEYIDLHGRGNRQFTLTELYGSIILESMDMDKSITQLQENWEREK